jgi:hypothetical protein
MLTRCRSISSQGCLCYNAIAENHKENFNSLYLGMGILLSFLFSMIRSSKTEHFLQSRGICILHFGTVQLRTRMDLCGMHTNCKFNPPRTITNRTRIEKLGFFFFFFKFQKNVISLHFEQIRGYWCTETAGYTCITCSCRCCNSSSSALTFGFWLSPFWKKRFQEEDHIAYKQFLSLSKHVSHDVSKFK